MDKKKTEQVLAVVLIAVFVFILAGSVGKIMSKSKPKAIAQAAASSAPAAAPVSLNISPHATAEKKAEPAAQDELSGGDRDPFAPINAQGGPAGISGLNLTGITTTGSGKIIAIINETMVSSGDKIGEFTVVNITADKVVLKDSKQEVDLKLEQ